MIRQQLSPKFLIYAIALSICHGIPGAIPLLPTFQQEFNLNSYEVSSCLSYFSYSAFVGTPFSGYIYSKLPKKVYIFLVNFIFLVGILGIAFSPNYTCLLFFRVVQGLGSAGMNILIYLLPAEYYTGLERAKIMGKSIGYLAIGLFIIPLLTGYLALFSWRYSFISLSVPTIYTLAILFITDLTEKITRSYTPFSFKQIKEVLTTPYIPLLLFTLFIAAGVDLTVPSLFSLFSAETYHYSSSTIGIIYAFSNFGMFVGSSWLLGKLLRTKHFPLLLFLSALCVSSLLISFTKLPPFMFPVAFFAFFCLDGLLNPYLNYSISNCLPPALLTIGITVSSTIFRAGQGFVTAFFAYANSKIGYDLTYLLVGSVYFFIIIILIPYVRKQQKNLS